MGQQVANHQGPGCSTVVVIGTGGTIASSEKSPGIAEKTSGAAGLVEALPALPGIDVRATDFRKDYPLGWDIHWSLLCDLRMFIEEQLASPDVVGAVITHGTDVLEEVAQFIDLTVTSDKPVVFTGAMRNQSLLGYDGARNLSDAIMVAANPCSRDRGTLVCFNGKILPATDAAKLSTSEVEAFGSPNQKTLGAVDRSGVRFNGPASRSATFAVEVDRVPDVPLAWTYACANGTTLGAISADCDGLVIAGTGLGHVPSPWVADIQRLLAEGIPVVIASRCGSGSTAHGYAGAGGDFHLAEIGALFAGERRALQTRMELMCALSSGLDLDDIRVLFPAPGLSPVDIPGLATI